MTIKESFAAGYEKDAQEYVKSINDVLRAEELPEYNEPKNVPDVYNDALFGRSELDHHGAQCLHDIGEMGIKNGNDQCLKLISWNPYRVAFLPSDFGYSYRTDFVTQIWDEDVELNFGSAHQLIRELIDIAPELKIEIKNSDLTKEQIILIGDMKTFESDEENYFTDLRSAWFVLFEGARLAIEQKVALSLAG